MASERPDRVLTVPALELRAIFHDSGFRWLLRGNDGIELWRGMDHLGTLSGDAIRHLIEHHLATAALQAAIQGELCQERKPLARASPGPPSPDARARLRAGRRARRR